MVSLLLVPTMPQWCSHWLSLCSASWKLLSADINRTVSPGRRCSTKRSFNRSPKICSNSLSSRIACGYAEKIWPIRALLVGPGSTDLVSRFSIVFRSLYRKESVTTTSICLPRDARVTYPLYGITNIMLYHRLRSEVIAEGGILYTMFPIYE